MGGGCSSKFSAYMQKWKARCCDPEVRREFWFFHWNKIFFMCIYITINLILFADAVERFRKLGANTWIQLARGFGAMLNLNCAIILLPVSRTFLSWIRNRWTLRFIPLDDAELFHRIVAYVIVFAGFCHGAAHYYNYGCCAEQYLPDIQDPTASMAAWSTLAGVTGNLLVLIIIIMYSAANFQYRRSQNYSVFWLVHHLFIPFMVFTLMHGPNFWKWFLAPGTIYFFERLARFFRGRKRFELDSVRHHPCGVIELRIKKGDFRYQAGMYAYVNCPYLSRFEWHPFTISSSPEDDILTFHIRAVGDWTRDLRELLSVKDSRILKFSSWLGPDYRLPILRLDGPFGAPAEHFWEYEYLILVAAGIGVTPYAAILQDIRRRREKGNLIHIKRLYFFWISRDQGSWEWFQELLSILEHECSSFIEVHTYMTGALDEQSIREIIFSSTEYRSKTNNRGSRIIFPTVRAVYDYDAVHGDELSFKEGDLLEVMETDEDDWCRGKKLDTNEVGLFPGSYTIAVDKITKLAENRNRHYGRPNWEEIFDKIRDTVERENSDRKNLAVGVFFCGPPVMGRAIFRGARKSTGKGDLIFRYHKEHF